VRHNEAATPIVKSPYTTLPTRPGRARNTYNAPTLRRYRTLKHGHQHQNIQRSVTKGTKTKTKTNNNKNQKQTHKTNKKKPQQHTQPQPPPHQTRRCVETTNPTPLGETTSNPRANRARYNYPDNYDSTTKQSKKPTTLAKLHAANQPDHNTNQPHHNPYKPRTSSLSHAATLPTCQTLQNEIVVPNDPSEQPHQNTTPTPQPTQVASHLLPSLNHRYRFTHRCHYHRIRKTTIHMDTL